MSAPELLNYQDTVRLLVLLSSGVLAWSSWKQYAWQRTQAKRDEAAENAHEKYEALTRPVPTAASPRAEETEEARKQRERENVAKLAYARAKNTARPFFDTCAFFYFLLGFVISLFASLIDIVWSDTLTRIINSIRHALQG